MLTPAVLVQHLQGSEALDEVIRLARDVLRRRLTPQLALVGPALGVDGDEGLVDRVADVALASLLGETVDLDEFPAVVAHLDERLRIAATIEERLASMDKLEFEAILRGIFEDDEALLIGVGGVIGAGIGCLQAVIVIGLDLA